MTMPPVSPNRSELCRPGKVQPLTCLEDELGNHKKGYEQMNKTLNSSLRETAPRVAPLRRQVYLARLHGAVSCRNERPLGSGRTTDGTDRDRGRRDRRCVVCG